MGEQPPAFVVVDKRKFTAEGERREGAPVDEPRDDRAPEPAVVSSAKVVTMPPRTPEAAENATRAADDLRDEDMAGALEGTGTGGLEFGPDALGDERRGEAGGELDAEFADDAGVGEPRSAAETAAQDAAYRQTSRELDSLLQQSNPGAPQPSAVTFEHVIQSFYLSAIMAMGAGTEPGQKPRIDILGARQSIDMLALLEDKTRGNLSAQEGELLKGIMFELRMMFLELTNAISRQALAGPAPGAPSGGRPGGLR